MSDNWSFVLARPELMFPEAALAGPVSGRHILITGAGGSIGFQLAHRVAALGPDRLTLLEAHEASLWRLRQSLEGAGIGVPISYVLADVRDRPKVRATLGRARCDVIFHLAAYKHVALAEENVDQAVGVNLVGTLNLVEAAAETEVEVVVLPTTDKTVYPTSLYGCTKRVIERLVRSARPDGDLPALRVARLVNVLGSQGSVVEVFTRQIVAGEAVPVTDLATDRYYITMDEAVGFLLGVAGQPESAGVYLIETGAPIRTIDLARRIHRRVHPAGAPELKVRVTGLKAGERLHEVLAYSDETRRPTNLAGISALDASGDPGPLDGWLVELRRLRRDLYDWEPAELRAHLFELAAASRPTSKQLGVLRG